MNDPKPKETQQELFTEFSATPKKTERYPAFSRSNKPILISTHAEQLLMIGILAILVLCGVFFLGVLRGQSIGSAPAPIPPARADRPSAPIAPARPQTASPGPVTATQASSTPVRAAVTPPARLPNKPYTIQLVTHRKKEFAETEMNSLRSQGIYSFLIPSGDYFLVCAGQYASKEEAKADLARFSSRFKDCFLRRR